jgi:hypothetical protein
MIDLYILDILSLEKPKEREFSFFLMVPTIRVIFSTIPLKQIMVSIVLTLLNIKEDSEIMSLIIRVHSSAKVMSTKATIRTDQGLKEHLSGKTKLVSIPEHLIKKTSYMVKV